MKSTILIVDDETFARRFLKMVLAPQGHEVLTAEHTKEADTILEEVIPDLIFLDIKMPGEDGLSWLKRRNAAQWKERRPEVVIITGHGSVASAVEAMKLGAADYLEKPFNSPDAVSLVVERVLERRRLAEENRRLRAQLRQRYGHIVGRSEPMQALYHMIDRVGPLPITVLIRGESGTGKELVARSIHEHSERNQNSLLAINCAAVPETLLESTLFGHEKGAFTGADRMRKGYFEEAQGGTLFLDEVGDMSPSLQARLLRVLQEQRFTRVGGVREIKADVRIIAATHRDLPKLVHEGTFRQDLYYRLKVIELIIPPLRERPGDVPLLGEHFLQRTAQQFGRGSLCFSPALMATLNAYTWPGNVRELEHTIARMVALAARDTLDVEDLPPDFPLRALSAPRTLRSEEGVSGDSFEGVQQNTLDFGECTLEEARSLFEERYLRYTLERACGNVSRAAELAGIARQHLHRKLKRYHIDTSEYKSQL